MNFLTKSFQFLTGMLLIGFVFSSCEKAINVTLQPAAGVLAVNAWITNLPTKQVVALTMTQPYFNSAQPQGVSGATVTIQDLTKGTMYSFVENPSISGSYEWTPSISTTFGVVGHTYQLNMMVNGQLFQATSRMGRVPPIDSITFGLDPDDDYSKKLLAQFWAVDPKGVGDTYWIRTTINGVLQTLNFDIAYDAGFEEGTGADGVEFLYPIRSGIFSPQHVGDHITVELISLNIDSFNHLSQIAQQTNRPDGFGQLFDTPLANVSTNITNANKTKAVGFFNVGSVSTLSATVTKLPKK